MSHQAFVLWMGIGMLLWATLAWIVLEEIQPATAVQYAVMFGCGVIWGTGTLGYTRAVQLIGLSRSTPVKNFSAVIGTLLGIVVLQEFSITDGSSMALVLGGSLAVTVSATLLGGLDEHPDSNSPKLTAKTKLYGFACALWAAIGFSIYPIPMRMYYSQGIGPAEFVFFMGLGCFLVLITPALFAGRGTLVKNVTWHDRRLAMLSGAMWAAGTLCAGIAVKLIGVAVTWPLTKSTIVAALYGAFVLKEVDLVNHRRGFVLGIVLSVVGVTLLAVATTRAGS